MILYNEEELLVAKSNFRSEKILNLAKGKLPAIIMATFFDSSLML